MQSDQQLILCNVSISHATFGDILMLKIIYYWSWKVGLFKYLVLSVSSKDVWATIFPCPYLHWSQQQSQAENWRVARYHNVPCNDCSIHLPFQIRFRAFPLWQVPQIKSLLGDSSFSTFYYTVFIYFACAHVYVLVQVPWYTQVDVRRHLAQVNSLLLSCGSWELNSALQAWQ